MSEPKQKKRVEMEQLLRKKKNNVVDCTLLQVLALQKQLTAVEGVLLKTLKKMLATVDDADDIEFK